MRITVVAMGKIGLPLAVQFASKGHEVLGVDVNPTVVDLVNKGEEPFPGEAPCPRCRGSLGRSGRLLLPRRLHVPTRRADSGGVVGGLPGEATSTA